MAKIFSSIGVYDTLSTTFNCCCSFDSEHILLGNSNGIFKYNVFTKDITQIYSAQLYITAMTHYNGNIYFADTPNSSSRPNRLCRLIIDTLSISSYELSQNSSTSGYSYSHGTIKVAVDDVLPYVTYSVGRTYWSGATMYNRTAYTSFRILKLRYDLSSIIDGITFTTEHISNRTTYYRYPLSSIYYKLPDDRYKLFWYSYYYTTGSRDSETTEHALQGFTTNMNPSLSISTFDNEVGEFNAFEDSDNYYILTNKYLIELNKETETTRVLRDNPTSLAPLHYAYVGDDVYAISGANLIKLTVNDINISYDIKSQDGTQTLASLTNSAPISKFIFNYDGDNVVAELTTLSGVQYLYYTPQVISGKRLAGYSTKPNAINPEYNINEIYNVAITDNLTFYEVYKDYKPPARTFELNLYRNSAEPNRVDKTNYLVQIGTLYGAFRDETSITDMAITIQQSEFPQFNYVYIPIFGRYYYVTDITNIRQNLWDISLSIDVLMSYKDAIISCKGFIERNEFTFNSNLVDNKRVVEQGYEISEHTITNDLFDTEPNFVLQGMELGTWNPST